MSINIFLLLLLPSNWFGLKQENIDSYSKTHPILERRTL